MLKDKNKRKRKKIMERIIVKFTNEDTQARYESYLSCTKERMKLFVDSEVLILLRAMKKAYVEDYIIRRVVYSNCVDGITKWARRYVEERYQDKLKTQITEEANNAIFNLLKEQYYVLHNTDAYANAKINSLLYDLISVRREDDIKEISKVIWMDIRKITDEILEEKEVF
jgi:hypothetical protein